jgi:hypothetical protein
VPSLSFPSGSATTLLSSSLLSSLKNGIRFGPVTKGLENLPNGVKGTSYIDCPCHHASDRQYRSHAFYRAQRHQWEVGLSSPNRILDKSRKHCGAATSFWHQRLHLKARSTAFYRTHCTLTGLRLADDALEGT